MHEIPEEIIQAIEFEIQRIQIEVGFGGRQIAGRSRANSKFPNFLFADHQGVECGIEVFLHYIPECAYFSFGRFSKDSLFRRWGLHLAERGGKNAKEGDLCI
jgi:hypothetical protein